MRIKWFERDSGKCIHWCPYDGEEKDNQYKLNKAMALPFDGEIGPNF